MAAIVAVTFSSQSFAQTPALMTSEKMVKQGVKLDKKTGVKMEKKAQ